MSTHTDLDGALAPRQLIRLMKEHEAAGVLWQRLAEQHQARADTAEAALRVSQRHCVRLANRRPDWAGRLGYLFVGALLGAAIVWSVMR